MQSLNCITEKSFSKNPIICVLLWLKTISMISPEYAQKWHKALRVSLSVYLVGHELPKNQKCMFYTFECQWDHEIRKIPLKLVWNCTDLQEEAIITFFVCFYHQWPHSPIASWTPLHRDSDWCDAPPKKKKNYHQLQKKEKKEKKRRELAWLTIDSKRTTEVIQTLTTTYSLLTIKSFAYWLSLQVHCKCLRDKHSPINIKFTAFELWCAHSKSS